jgi:hypothetical protein
MKVAKIKFSEEQIEMLIIGKVVTVRLPDAELQLTMDRTYIELRETADKLKGLGVKPSVFDGLGDLFGGDEVSKGAAKFNDMVQGFLDRKKK